MQPTNFSKYLTDFLAAYLPHQRGSSRNTIASYRDTFVLLIRYMESIGIKLNKLAIESISKDRVTGFLQWVQVERKNCDSSRNARLAAIHSFYKYLRYQHPEHLYYCQQILTIPMKKTPTPVIDYLSLEGITLLLQQPDSTTIKGRRDLALLSLMYDTGARVQEIIDLVPGCIYLNKPATIRVTGKGSKTRVIPMLDTQLSLLKNYMNEYNLTSSAASSHPLFFNYRNEPLTRAGINYILQKYATMANAKNATVIPNHISCHCLRHSKAMHLLQAGVNLVYIRDFLGHISVTTTEIYARVDSRKKREVLESAYVNVAPKKVPDWLKDESLLAWLKSF